LPCGIVRTDFNKTGINYLHGFIIDYLPVDGFAFPGNVVDWQTPNPAFFGNLITWLPVDGYAYPGNLVTWATPNPAEFGNIFGGPFAGYLLLVDGTPIWLVDDSEILLVE
jgi:hypothetical protein